MSFRLELMPIASSMMNALDFVSGSLPFFGVLCESAWKPGLMKGEVGAKWLDKLHEE